MKTDGGTAWLRGRRWRHVALVLLSVACESPARSERDAPDELARAFYRWHTTPADRGGSGFAVDRTIGRFRTAFTPELRSALDEDLVASRASPGNVVGLDGDPFTDSQDPCERYLPQAAVVTGDSATVTIMEVCEPGAPGRSSVRVILVRRDDSWHLADFVARDGRTLTDQLRQLRLARLAPAEPPR